MSPTGDDRLATGAEDVPDPAAEFAFRDQVDRVADEKRQAREAPDVPWRIWWFHSGSKWYVVLAFFVLDVWLVSYGLEVGLLAIATVLLWLAVYGEFLLYRYLYYVPSEDAPRPRMGFRRSWIRPVQYGRWTAEGQLQRAGGTVVAPEPGPDPKEFL